MVSKRWADGNDLEPEILPVCNAMRLSRRGLSACQTKGALSDRWNSAFPVFLYVVFRLSFTLNPNFRPQITTA
jgi:hypothetical protein